EQFIVIDLRNEWYFMRIFSRKDRKIAHSSCECVATSFQSELNYILRIEINWIWRKCRACAMFYSLVNRQNGKISCVCEPACIEDCGKISQCLGISVRR